MKVLVAVNNGLVAVLVNVPHSVGVATMVSVKGAVGLEKRLNPEHVTVFPLVVHSLLGSLSSTESMVNSDGNWSTRGELKLVLQPGALKGHRSEMVKVMGSPTVTVPGVAVLSRQSSALQSGSGSDAPGPVCPARTAASLQPRARPPPSHGDTLPASFLPLHRASLCSPPIKAEGGTDQRRRVTR